VSYLPLPHARRVASPSWVLDRRRLCRLHRVAMGCAARVAVGCARTMHVGHAPLCNWAERGFGPVAVELVFHFLNIFKFLQIENFL
jgi:hypothetical protein